MTVKSNGGSAKERLLASAAQLFYAKGLLATSVDAITAEHCAFLLGGAMVRAGLAGTADRLHHARRAAAAMVDALDTRRSPGRVTGASSSSSGS
ncbi:hypothetical protein [Cryobacterium aureum]|uniref:hypothetical protein n=1 Tax=Cryobacterium aureum TaxID=995037 RepID=UPI000CF55093|nr:hypothetical protein [Cryobacterium aureum]